MSELKKECIKQLSIIKEIDDYISRFGVDSLVFKVLTKLKQTIKEG